VALPAPVAGAAPPGNDEVAGARVITAIPSRLTFDSTDATRNPATDVRCVEGRSVWYRFTPRTTVVGRAVTFGSHFDTVLTVFEGTPTAAHQVACSDDVAGGDASAVQVRFVAGRTYLIAVSACCVDPELSPEPDGGKGVLRLYRPRPLALSAPMTRARAGDVSGRALFAGTVRCTNPASFTLRISVSQRNGADVARGTGRVARACGRTRHAWSLRVDSDTPVAFRPGRAVVTVRRSADDGFSTRSTSHSFVVRLRRQADAAPVVVSRPGSTRPAGGPTMSS
jgi:hypothetical protein